MSYRAYTEQERLDIIERIKSVKECLVAQQRCLAVLESNLNQGVWQSDMDYASMPLPKPSCYICVNRVAVLNGCSLSHEYGIACSDYRHFSEGTK